MSRSAWVLFDPVSSESYVLPTNPSGDSGSFAGGKPVVYSAVAASFQSIVTGKQNPKIGRAHV